MPDADDRILEALLSSTSDAVYAMARSGHVLRWSWGAEQSYGFTGDEAMGKTVFELIVPFDRREELLRAVLECLETGSCVFESSRRRRDGNPVDVQVILKHVPAREGDDAFVAVSERDISDQKRLEKTLFDQIWSLSGVQAVLQSVMDGSRDYSIIATDLDGKIQQWNAGAQNDFGFPPEDVKGQDCRGLLSSPMDAHPEAWDAALGRARNEGRFEGEFLAVRRDGSRFPVRANINLRKGPYDDPLGFVLIARDLSVERKAEEERRTLQQRLDEVQRIEEMNRLKTTLLNTASHELSTPLTPLRLQVHMLRGDGLGTLTEAQRKAVELIARNVERLSEVVASIVEVTRLQGGRMQLDVAQVDLRGPIDKAVESQRPRATQKGQTLDVAVLAAMPAKADPGRIEETLRHLISNAVKFTGEGGRITVKADDAPSEWTIRVQDTGTGLTRPQIATLFQPFSQAHDTMQHTRSGAGLSLFIAKGIVEAHGGRIWCESPGPGRGCTFSFTLPKPSAAPAAAAAGTARA